MRTINSNQVVKLPKGVSAKVNARVVTIRGPRGKLVRDFRHLAMDIRMVNRKKVMVEKWFGSKKEIAAVRTVCSHIENMIKGKFWPFRLFTIFIHITHQLLCMLVL